MKKKNILSAVLAALMLISMMGAFALPAAAEVYTTDEWEFKVENYEAVITAYKGDSSWVTVPEYLYDPNDETYENYWSVTTIGERAFYGNTVITDLTLSEEVVTIEKEAFRGCTNLKSVTYELMDYQWSPLRTIGDYAFADCTKLPSFRLHTDVEYLGEGAFMNCTALTALYTQETLNWTKVRPYTFSGCTKLSAIALPESMEEIGAYAFEGCSALTAVPVVESTICRLMVVGEGAFMKSGVRSADLGERIYEVGKKAFADCASLQSVKIYSGTVGESAFENCYRLTSVSLGSVSAIGRAAFRFCSGLTSVVLPDTLETLGEYAFNGCAALSAVYLPEGQMNALAPYTFRNCTSLSFIEIPENIQTVGAGAFTGCTALARAAVICSDAAVGTDAFPAATEVTDHPFDFTVDGESATLTEYSGTAKKVKIPASVEKDGKEYAVTTLGDDLFYEKSDRILAVEIPEGIETIGKNAFRDMDQLAAVRLPESLQTIGEFAFFGCGKLNYVRIPQNVKTIEKSAFNSCAAMTRVYFCEGIETIGETAFYYCNKLNEVVLPKSVKTVSAKAFGSCAALKSLTLLSDATVYAADSFSTATVLTVAPATYAFTVTDGSATITAYNGCETEVSVPATVSDGANTYFVTAIGDKAFYQKGSLQKVTLPDSVKTIGTWAFYGCEGLKEVVLSENLVSVGDSAFRGLPLLKHLEMPRSLTSLGDLVFMDSGLESVTLSKGLTELPRNGFYNCQALRSVVIPANIETIGSYCFYRCTSLAHVTMEKGLKYIHYDAFRGCTSLTEVVIPSTIDSIGSSAFAGCTALKTVTIYNKYAGWGDGAFPENAEVLWLDASEEPGAQEIWSYTAEGNAVTVTGYSGSDTVLEIPAAIEGLPVTAIAPYAFEKCTALTEVTVPESVTSLGSYAFAGCTGLRTIHLPEGITDFGFYVFNATAYSNNEANWDGELLYLGSYLLDAKTTVTSCEVKEGTKIVAADAFYNCTALSQVILPASVTHIGPAAFMGCSSLKTAYVLNKNAVLGTDAFPATTTVLYELPQEEPKEEFVSTVSDHQVTISKYEGTEAEVIIPETMTVEGKEYPVTTISSAAFQNNKTLTKVTLPDTLTTIGSFAFSGCTALTELTVPASVTNIGRYAFSGCSNLTKVTYEGANTLLGTGAMPSTAAATYWWSVTVADGAATVTAYSGTETEVTVPAYAVVNNARYPVTLVGTGAFMNNSTLRKVVLSEGIKTLNSNSFKNCANLEEVKFPSTLKNIYGSSFETCRKLGNVTFPEGLEYIGSLAFSKCTGLTEVTIPQSVTSIGRYAFSTCSKLATATIYNPNITLGSSVFPTTTEIIYKEGIDKTKPYLTIDPANTNLAILNTASLKASRVYWGYAGEEELEVSDWNAFTAAVPSAIRVSDYNPTEGEVYAMEKQGYYLFWINYTDANGTAQSICRTVYAAGTLDENYGKPYLEFDESGKVAWMNLNGTTVQKMYWGYIGDTDYKYINWDEFCTRVRGNGSYLPDYGVKNGEGYVVNEVGYYRFVIVYLDAQGIRQERYFTIKAETPATAPSMDNSTLSNVATFINEEGYTAKTYYGYIGEENTKYVDFNDFKATATDFTTDFGTPAGKTFKLTKAGYWRFVINYTVNGATKDAICTVYVDEADLALGTPKLTQSGGNVTLNANGATVSKVYVGYMGTDAVEIDSWADYTANRKTNAVTYGPKDGTTLALGTTAGYYTVVVSYNTGGAEQLAFYTFNI